MTGAAPLLLRVEAKRVAAAAFSTDDPVAGARAACAETARVFDAAWARLRPAVETQGAIACRAGCAACCHQDVAVLPVEAVAIAATIGAATPEAAAWRAAVHATAARLAGMDAPARRRAGIPCPFLDAAGGCGIYDVRPLRCRGLHSRDADRCRGTAAPGAASDRSAFPIEPLHLADAALAGLAEAWARRGAPAATRELTRAVAALLAAPARAGAVADGRDPLDEARLAGSAATMAEP